MTKPKTPKPGEAEVEVEPQAAPGPEPVETEVEPQAAPGPEPVETEVEPQAAPAPAPIRGIDAVYERIEQTEQRIAGMFETLTAALQPKPQEVQPHEQSTNEAARTPATKPRRKRISLFRKRG